MTTHCPRRGGFTLIELLIVIAILALLSALAVGGYMRIRQTQTASNTDKILANRLTALNRLWSAARDQADKEFREDTESCKSVLTRYCDGDSDRAKALYLYAKLKSEFPQTFWQAGRPVVLRDASNNVVLSIPPRKLFSSNPAIQSIAKLNLTTDPLFDAMETDKERKAFNQSAVLIYLILTERGARGEADEAGSAKTINLAAKDDLCYLLPPPPPAPALPPLHPLSGEPATAFADAWDQPIGFARWATNGDLQDPNNGFSRRGSKSADPFDPVGRLTPAAWTHKAAAANSLFGTTTAPTNAWTTNWVPTLISMGADGKINYSLAVVDSATGLTLLRDADDEAFSYKQRREGN